jgi:hypothetical protein
MKAKNQRKYVAKSLSAKVSLSDAKFDVFTSRMSLVSTLYILMPMAICVLNQGILDEGEGSVPLSS